MPTKSKKSTKKASESDPWAFYFLQSVPRDTLLEVLKEYDITSEEIVKDLNWAWSPRPGVSCRLQGAASSFKIKVYNKQ